MDLENLIDYKKISKFKELEEDFILSNWDKLHIPHICQFQKLSNKFINENKKKFKQGNWNKIAQFQKNLSVSLIKENKKKLKWDFLKRNMNLISKKFIDIFEIYKEDIDISNILKDLYYIKFEDFQKVIKDWDRIKLSFDYSYYNIDFMIQKYNNFPFQSISYHNISYEDIKTLICFLINKKSIQYIKELCSTKISIRFLQGKEVEFDFIDKYKFLLNIGDISLLNDSISKKNIVELINTGFLKREDFIERHRFEQENKKIIELMETFGCKYHYFWS